METPGAGEIGIGGKHGNTASMVEMSLHRYFEGMFPGVRFIDVEAIAASDSFHPYPVTPWLRKTAEIKA